MTPQEQALQDQLNAQWAAQQQPQGAGAPDDLQAQLTAQWAAQQQAPQAQAPATGSGGYESGTFAEWANEKANAVDAAIAGNAAEKLPSIYSPEFEAYTGGNPVARAWSAAKATPTAMFGHDEDTAAKALEQVPGSSMDRDANGNPVIVTPDGKRFYVNVPGLDRDDALRFGANMASYLPSGKLAAGFKGLVPRAGVMAAGTGATNFAGQLAGREHVDPMEAIITGAVGGVTEFVPPIAGAIAQKLKQVLGRAPSRAELAQAFAKTIGRDPKKLTADEIAEFGGLMEEQGAGASAQATQGQGEFGFRYTQGQKTQNFDQLSKEERLRSGTGYAADAMRGVDTQNEQTLSAILDNIGSRYTKGVPSTPVAGIGRAQSALQSEANELATRTKLKYDSLDTTGRVSIPSVQGLPPRLESVLREFPINEKLTPISHEVLRRIKQSTELLSKRRGKGGAFTAIDPKAMPRDMEGLNTERKIISKGFGSNPSPTDREALTLLKNEYDNWMDDAYAETISSGKLMDLREAQKLRAQYGARFEHGGQAYKDDQVANSVVEKMLDRHMDPDQIVNAIYGSAQVSKADAARIIRRLKQAAPDNPELMDGLRTAHFLRMTQDKNGQRLGIAAIRNNIRATEHNTPAVPRELYTKGEWEHVKRLAEALDPLVAKGMFGRSSGSAERAMRMANPWLRKIFEKVDKYGELWDASRIYSPVAKPQRPSVLLPAAGAAGAQEYQR